MTARGAFDFYLASGFPTAQGLNGYTHLFGGFADADFHAFILHTIDIKAKKSIDISSKESAPRFLKAIAAGH
jgi:hypothetical protein